MSKIIYYVSLFHFVDVSHISEIIYDYLLNVYHVMMMSFVYSIYDTDINPSFGLPFSKHTKCSM